MQTNRSRGLVSARSGIPTDAISIKLGLGGLRKRKNQFEGTCKCSLAYTLDIIKPCFMMNIFIVAIQEETQRVSIKVMSKLLSISVTIRLDFVGYTRTCPANLPAGCFAYIEAA